MTPEPGFAAADNRAAALSRSEFIAVLNPDAFPKPDWLERLVQAARTYGAEAVASLQLDDADPDVLDGAGDCLSIAGFP
jgi:GT2 family glycosyltransferase